MRSLNRNLHPKSGYYFEESDGSRIFGDSWPGVIKRVADYRKRAGLPAGNPVEEVVNQVCTREPTLCVQDNPAYLHQLKKSNLKPRLLGWLNKIIARKNTEPPKFVDEAERKRRANICANCPLNTALPGGCASCTAAVNELRKSILGRKFVDGRLHGCAALGEDLAVSVHIEQVAEAVESGPDNCWRKRTL